MSTTSEKLRGLVESLYLQTDSGKIDWNLSTDRQSVWAKIGSYRIEAADDQIEGFEQDIRITVFSEEGDQIDTFSDSYFRGLIPSNSQFNSYYSLMATFLEMARRQASGADAAIEMILKTLGGTAVTDQPSKGGSFIDDLDDDVPF
jgi:hypothetical protein